MAWLCLKPSGTLDLNRKVLSELLHHIFTICVVKNIYNVNTFTFLLWIYFSNDICSILHEELICTVQGACGGFGLTNSDLGESWSSFGAILQDLWIHELTKIDFGIYTRHVRSYGVADLVVLCRFYSCIQTTRCYSDWIKLQWLIGGSYNYLQTFIYPTIAKCFCGSPPDGSIYSFHEHQVDYFLKNRLYCCLLWTHEPCAKQQVSYICK